MTTKHTPGPWRIADASQIIVAMDGARSIAYAAADRAQVFINANSVNETALANARLIAAAPELLALLKRIAEPYGVETRDDTPCACKDPYDTQCKWSGYARDLNAVESVEERLGLGEMLLIVPPAGECPECGGLVYDERAEDIHAALQDARAAIAKAEGGQ